MKQFLPCVQPLGRCKMILPSTKEAWLFNFCWCFPRVTLETSDTEFANLFQGCQLMTLVLLRGGREVQFIECLLCARHTPAVSYSLTTICWALDIILKALLSTM